MPGLVLSLSLSFFPSSKTAMLQLNVIRDSSRAAGRCRRGGLTPRSQPLPLLSTLLSPFFIWLPPISPLRVTEPGDKVCLPRLPILRLQCRTTTPHTTVEDDISSPSETPAPHPCSPLIQSARPEFF